MKNITYLIRIFTVTTFALLLSCDVLDVTPSHVSSANNAFKNLNDIEQYLNGVYSSFQGVNYYGSLYSALPDMMAEDLYENSESLGNFRAVVDWGYSTNDALISAAWITPYATIADANLLLTNIERFEENVAGRKNRLKGQALAIRAMAHFDLLRYFGASYDRNSTELGIPIKIDNEIETVGRNTVTEVYNRIYEDLADAKALLSAVDETINTAEDRNKIDVLVVDAILARVALYAKDYATAISSASTVISSSLDLATINDFPTIWNADAVADEVIWSIAYQPGELNGGPAGNIFFSVNNRLSFKPSSELLATYDQTNDIRYATYFSTTLSGFSSPDRDGELVPIKYLGRNGATDGLVNWKVFRVAEMYLIRAEASANTSGQEAAALNDLNTLRAARITGYVNASLSGQALQDAIALERRKELFLEGHRWFDIRRAGVGITRGVDCGAPATNCSLSSSSFRKAWPIPQDEIQANPIIATQQNQGYN